MLKLILETTRHLLSRCDGRIDLAAAIPMPELVVGAVPLLYDEGLGTAAMPVLVGVMVDPGNWVGFVLGRAPVLCTGRDVTPGLTVDLLVMEANVLTAATAQGSTLSA